MWEKTNTETYSGILSNRDLHNGVIQGDLPNMLTTILSFNNAFITQGPYFQILYLPYHSIAGVSCGNK